MEFVESYELIGIRVVWVVRTVPSMYLYLLFLAINYLSLLSTYSSFDIVGVWRGRS